MKKKPKYNQNSVIRGALRRAFARSPIVQEVMNESRREVPRYKADGTRHKKNWVQRQCQVCDQWNSSSKTVVDHINPVISVDEGFQDWNEFVDRLWCNKSNLQRICDTCHDKKTAKERYDRNFLKDLELISALEHTSNNQFHWPQIKKRLQKFNKKKLATYPKDFAERINKVRIKIGMKSINL